MADHLINIRNLPKHILAHLDKLVVNRVGSGFDASMITRDIINAVDPANTYQFICSKHDPISVEVHCVDYTPLQADAKAPSALIPPHTRVTGTWNPTETVFMHDANILGGMGTLVLNDTHMDAIPVVDATAEQLAFYGARLIRAGEPFSLESKQSLPLTEVCIGENYAAGYIAEAQLSGGDYIETHDQPHLWIPTHPQCKGHILLGKQDNNTFFLTGFRIPFGTAVYLSPYALHADAYLVGEYLVVYTVTDDYSTVLFRNNQNKPIPLSFSLVK